MKINRYSYAELRAAVEADANEDNVNALGEWFESYGTEYWNGEYFDADGIKIYPIVSDDEDCELLGYRAE